MFLAARALPYFFAGCFVSKLICGTMQVGTCESFFFVRIESRIESAVRFVFESNFRIESALYHASRNGLQAYRTACYTYSEYLIHRYFVFVMNESDVRNSELSTCLFQFSHKARETMLLYAYFTPKVVFKRKFNHHQSFLYE